MPIILNLYRNIVTLMIFLTLQFIFFLHFNFLKATEALFAF